MIKTGRFLDIFQLSNLGSISFLDETLSTLVDEMVHSYKEMFGIPKVRIGLFHNEKLEWINALPPEVKPPRITQLIIRQVIETNKEFIFRNKTRSAQANGLFPLIYESAILGLAYLGHDKADFFLSDERLTLLRGHTAWMARALYQSRRVLLAQKSLDQVEALRKIGVTNFSSSDPHASLEQTLTRIRDYLKPDVMNLLLLNKKTKRLEYLTGTGVKHKPKLRIIDEVNANQAAQTQTTVFLRGTPQENNTFFSRDLERDSIFEYVAIPLITRNDTHGVLEFYFRQHHSDRENTLKMLEHVAEQVAVAVDIYLLIKNLDKQNAELTQAYNATIEGLSRALELRDRETQGHTRRVAMMTNRLAERMGIAPEARLQIQRGAILHDIGKMGIPDAILLKPGSLSPQEWEVMKQHPLYAYNILAQISYLRPAIDIPLYHHERWDGSGYPYGLKGEKIPLAARIFSIVDVFDALTSDRPYRAAWSKAQALNYIHQQAGKHFDPQLITIFISMSSEWT